VTRVTVRDDQRVDETVGDTQFGEHVTGLWRRIHDDSAVIHPDDVACAVAFVIESVTGAQPRHSEEGRLKCD
jgi:hypothetical protein